MTILTIQSPLADQLQAIAAHEQRPIDDILQELLTLYHAQQTASVFEGLRGMAGLTLPSADPPPAPLTDEERAALAEAIAAGGPLSEDIIAARKHV